MRHVLHWEFFATLPEALAQTEPCPGTESRTVNCRDYKGNVVADSYCTRVGTKPTATRTCTARCPIRVEWQNEGDGSGDPLIFDLDGNGISLLSVNDGVMFDIDNDGDLNKTAWVDRNDGMLAFDENGNGRIDNQSELFGNIENAAYKHLSEYDSNQDSVMNKDDRIWRLLKMWIDKDTDGRTDRGELLSLGSLGIIEIDLNYDTVDEINNGSQVTGRGTFTRWIKEGFNRYKKVVSSVIEAFFSFSSQTVSDND